MSNEVESSPIPRAGKIALITGITGQDGSYLATLLLDKGYEVHGLIRRSSSFNTARIDQVYHDRHENGTRLTLHYADLSDSTCLCQIVASVRPNEIYNLGAMSHVKVSFEMSEYTADVDALGCLRLLNAIRVAGLTDTCKFYQASTSELYGGVQGCAQNEDTPFYPRSPYAVAKQYAYWICINYREAYGIFACNGVLFNHESPRRGPTFVTRKITRAVARLRRGLQACLYLGNMTSQRDWGHAREYVEGMWRMLQQDEPEDFVLATGETHTVKEFVDLAFHAGGMTLEWAGEGVDETGTVVAVDPTVFAAEPALADDEAAVVAPHLASLVGTVVVRIDPAYYRPTEVDLLLGDATKAKEKLGWEAKITFRALCAEMVLEDCKKVQQNDLTS